jgi:glutamyl-tRNA synthetase
MSKQIQDQAHKYAIKNAALHGGKADVGALVGKLKALFPDEGIKTLAGIAKETVDRVNALKMPDIEAQFKAFEAEGYELKPKEKEKGLPALDWAETGEKVVTRFAPNPNGPMHLGHCRAAVLSAEYAKKYGGKFLLRFEDTDPKVKKPMEDARELFMRDLAWLGYKPDAVSWASERFDSYYAYMKKVIQQGNAYVCTCDNDEFKKKKNRGIACPHRDLSAKDNLDLFEEMLSHRLKEGQAVLRIKTDLSHPDLSVRDWWAAKIVDDVKYSKLKDRCVFPSFNFQNAVDDHAEGVTLILRGVQHFQNAVKQKYLYGYLGWVFPHILHFGLVKMKGVLLSKSRIADLMKNDPTFRGYSDPRLGTVEAFREKGFVAQAIVDEIMELGTRQNDATVSLARLEDRNKGFIDRASDRFIFLESPVEAVVDNAEKMVAQLENYPGDTSAGVRKYALSAGRREFWIPQEEADTVKLGGIFRLKHAYNVRVVKKDGKKIDCAFVSSEHKTGIPIVNWLLPDETVKTEVLMLDGSTKKGFSEKALSKKKAGEPVRFEDFGYLVVKTNGKGTVRLNYTHP